MSGLLDAVAQALPLAAAGATGRPQTVMATAEWLEKQKKEKALRAFGKEVFGSGDPKTLTPERIYEAAQKYDVSPQEATELTMNYLAFKKQMKGDPRLVSVPMPDGRFRSSEVPESELQQFMHANPGAVQGQVYGQKNDPLEPYQIRQAQLQNERLKLQNQYMPKEQEAGLQAQQLQNERMKMQNQFMPKEMEANLSGAQLQNERLRMQNQFMPREQEAGLTGMKLSNQMKGMELENLKLAPEKEQKTTAFLNEIFSIQDPAKRTIDVLYKTGAKYGLSPKEVQNAMLAATKAQEQLTGKPEKDPNALTRKDLLTRVQEAYKPLIEAAALSGNAQQLQEQYQEDMRRAYNGETPLIFSGTTAQGGQQGNADPLGIRTQAGQGLPDPLGIR